MTGEEEQLLRGLAERVNRAHLGEKDAEADQFIRQNLGGNPDALYILAQTTLVQEYALNQVRTQMAELRAQLEPVRQQSHAAKPSSSGNLLGDREEARSAPPPPPPPPQRSPAGAYASDPVSGVGPGLAYPIGGYPIPGAPSGYGAPQGGFLRSAVQTAMGVAAGALAFEGIESLLHGFGGQPGFGGEYGRERPEIANNYYREEGSRDHAGMTDAGSAFADSMGPQHIPLEADHNTGLNEGAYLGGGQSDRDDLTAKGIPDRAEDSEEVGDDNVDYSAAQDDSVTADDIGEDDGDFGGDAGADFSGGDTEDSR